MRVVVARLTDWMANSYPPWAAYCALMACCLVAVDKRPGVRPVSIGEMLSRALAKLVMRSAGDQAKTACGDIQMCIGLAAGIESHTRFGTDEVGEGEKEMTGRGGGRRFRGIEGEKRGGQASQ